MSTSASETVPYDSGSFTLKADYTIANDGIKITPYVVLGNGGFRHDHTALFECTAFEVVKSGTYKGRRVILAKGLREAQRANGKPVIYYAKAATETKKAVKVKQDTFGYTYKVKKKKNGKVVKKNGKVVKKKSKKKTWHMANANEKVDLTGTQFTYNGYEVTLKCQILAAGGVKASKVVEFKIRTNKKPNAPGAVKAEIVPGQGAATTVANVYTESLTYSALKPITSLTFERLEETPVTGSWTTIGTKTNLSYTSGASGNKTKTIKLDKARSNLSITDYGLKSASRYQFKVSASNVNGSTPKTSGWYYTNPPEVSNVSHVRLNDSTNVVQFERDPRYIILGIIKDFRIQANVLKPSDPEFESGWKTLAKNTDFEGYPINPGQTDLDIMTKQYSLVAVKHKTCKKDAEYRYRIWSINYFDGSSGGTHQYSAYSALMGDEPTYNTPTAPKSLEAAADAELTKVTLKIETETEKKNSSADRLFIQRKINDGNWEDYPSSDGIEISALDYQDCVYTYVDDDIEDISGKTVQYQAAFGCTQVTVNGYPVEPIELNHGKSEYCTPVSVMLAVPPNKPNLVMPVNNQKIASDTATVRLAWLHSPKDGSEQTAAEVEYKRNDGEWVSINITDSKAAYVDLTLASPKEGEPALQANDVITWRVRTKGTHPDFSEWNSKEFSIVARPSIEITSLEDMSEISVLPLRISYNYTDASGTLDTLVLEIEQDNELLTTVQIDPSTLEIPDTYVLNDYIFEDEKQYNITLTAVSTTTLDTKATKVIFIKYINMNLTKGFMMTPSFDEDTGVSSITLSRVLSSDEDPNDVEDYDPDEEEIITSDAKVKSLYVYRVYYGMPELVDQPIEIDVSDYDSVMSVTVEDKFCPINVDFEYKLLQVTELGEVSVSMGTLQHYETLWWYVYWGGDRVLKTRWNPQGALTLSRPERQEVRYSGREYPVLYDSMANEETYSYQFTLIQDSLVEEFDDMRARDVLEYFKQLMRDGGVGIWKSFEGDVYYARFDFSYSVNYAEQNVSMWNCTLNITRIDEEGGL